MIGWAMWWRRTWWTLPLAVAVQALAMQNVQRIGGSMLPGWRVSWGWMLGAWNGSTLLLSPFLAAVAAMIVIRDWPRELQVRAAVLPRGAAAYLHIMTTVWAHGVAAQALTLFIGVGICLYEGVPLETATLPWQLFTGPAALLAAVALGVGVGVLFDDLWAVPIVGFGIFVAHRVFFWRVYPDLFTTKFPTWYVEDARPAPVLLIATIGLNLVTAFIIFLCLKWITGIPGIRSKWLLIGVAGGLLLAAAIYLPFVFAEGMTTYEYVR